MRNTKANTIKLIEAMLDSHRKAWAYNLQHGEKKLKEMEAVKIGQLLTILEIMNDSKTFNDYCEIYEIKA